MIEAIGGALGVAASIGHEALFVGVDLLRFAPVPGLELAGRTLLNIWDAVDMVEVSLMGTPFVALLLLTVDLSRRIVKRLCAWPSAARTSYFLFAARSQMRATP